MIRVYKDAPQTMTKMKEECPDMLDLEWPDKHIVKEIPVIFNLSTKTQGWKPPAEGPEMRKFAKLPTTVTEQPK